VGHLRASLSKSNGFGIEKSLGDVSLRRFVMKFTLAKFVTRVDVNLRYLIISKFYSISYLIFRSLSMKLDQLGTDPIVFVSSVDDGKPTVEKDLLSVVYKRVEKASPEFVSVYESIGQSIEIGVSTFIFRVSPEPVLNLYDFLMTTFVPHSTAHATHTLENHPTEVTKLSKREMDNADKIYILVKLASVQGW
jgi:vacuolar protein sorting-associated protein 13A/C